MAIEFRCPACDRLLKTPDDSAGRQAKCPNCGSVAIVPNTSPAAAVPPVEVASASPGVISVNPFADATPTPRLQPAHSSYQSENPYAPSATYAPDPTEVYKGTVGLKHRQVRFGQLWEVTYSIVSRNIGPCLLFGLAMAVSWLGLSILSNGVEEAVKLVGEGEPLLNFLGTLLKYIFNLFWQTLFQLSAAAYALQLARRDCGRPSVWSAAFSAYWRGFLVNFLILLVYVGGSFVGVGVPILVGFSIDQPVARMVTFAVGIGALCAIAVLMALLLYLSLYFVVDRGMGSFDAMKASTRFMYGNKLTLLGANLIVFIVGGLASLITCGLGLLLVMPLYQLLGAVAYLQATRQVTVDDGAPLS